MRCGVFVCDLCVNVTLYGGLRWTKQNNVFVLISHISAVSNRASDFAPRRRVKTLAYLPGSLVKLCQSQYRLKKHKMQVGEAKWPHVPYNIELELTKKYSAVFKHRRPWSLVGWGQEKGKKMSN